jgi:uncharacterized membrane protein YgcG
MKKGWLVLLFSLFLLPLSAQQRRVVSTLRGSVLDEATGGPLVGAMIVVDSTYHATADAKGSFSIPGIPRKPSQVLINYMGYETIVRTVDFNRATIDLGAVRMVEDSRRIEAVAVTAAATAVLQKGDTTQFNAAAFPTGADAYAGDLVNKLPGAEVNGGTVIVQGDTVKRAMIDGKMFFGDDVMAAMNNIPADVIESIQMFDEQTDEAKFAGIDDGVRQRTLNIVTKNKNNRMITANLEGGYGKQLDADADGTRTDHYLLSGVTNLFSESQSWTVSAGSNNVGRSGGGRMRGGRGGRGGGGGLSTSNAIGLNYSRNWNSKWEMNLNYDFNETRTKTESWNERLYFTENDGDPARLERTDRSGRSDSDNHSLGLRLEYTGTKDRIFFFGRGSYGLSDNAGSNIEISRIGEELINRINSPSMSHNKNYSANGNASWTRKLSDSGRTITLNLSGGINDGNGEREELKEGLEMSTNTSSTSDNWSRNYSGRLTYAEPLGGQSRLTLNYNYSRNRSESETVAWDLFENKLDSAQSRTTTRNQRDHSAGVGYVYGAEFFRFGLGLDFRASAQVNEDIFPEEKYLDHTFYTWQPYATARYTVERSKYFEFRYSGRANTPSLSDLQTVLTVNDNRLSVGNPDLKQSYSHDFRLAYNTSNSQKSTSFNVIAMARLTANSFANQTVFFDRDTVLADYYDYQAMAGSQLSTRVNLSGAVQMGANAGYSFLFKPIKTRVSINGGYELQRRPSYTTVTIGRSRKQLLNNSNEHSGSIRLRLTSAISEYVDFSVNSSTGLTYTGNSALSNSRTWRESVGAEASLVFFRSLTYNTDFSWNYQHNFNGTQNRTNNTYVWSMGFGYRFLKRRNAEFRVTAYDLLNQSQKAPTISYADTYQMTSWSRSMGRYFLATLTWRFNSMHGNSSGGRGEGRGSGGEGRGFEGGGRFEGNAGPRMMRGGGDYRMMMGPDQ